VEFIRRGRSAGLTLAQIGEILDVSDAGSPPCDRVHLLLTGRLAALDAQIADLVALRGTVAHLREAVAAAPPASQDADQICPYL